MDVRDVVKALKELTVVVERVRENTEEIKALKEETRGVKEEIRSIKNLMAVAEKRLKGIESKLILKDEISELRERVVKI